MLAPATGAASERTASSVEGTRQILAETYFGPAPLFFSEQSVANVPLAVDDVSITTGDEYGATAFYEAIDGGESNGQLWMARGPAEDPTSSFGQGSCRGATVTGPQQLGPYSAFFAQCDLSFIYRFLWDGRLYTVASKYYGGLTPEQLAPIVAAMTPVTSGARPVPRKVVLGSASYASPYGRGWGKEKPSTIFNGGDPSGLVKKIRWTKWGRSVSYASGLNSIFKPQGGYYRKQVVVKLRASRLRSCPGGGGPRAYTRLQIRVPKRPGGKLGKWFSWSGSKSICEFGFR
jgi:hypothetical protein